MRGFKRIAAVAALSFVPGITTAQTINKSSVNVTTKIAADGCGADKLQLTGFNMSPVRPAANQPATVTLTLKNLCSAASLNIPYKVTDQASTVASGTKTVAASSTATVHIPLTFGPGSHALDALLDANNSLHEPVPNRPNNNASAGILFNVAAPTVTLILHPEMLPTSVAAPPSIRVTKHNCKAATATDLANQILARHTRLPSPPAPFVPTPYPTNFTFAGVFLCKVEAEVTAFAVQLKNGWKIKSADVQSSGSGGNWSWVRRPSPGSTDATTKLQLTTFPGIPTLSVRLNVEIEGPQGMSPFQ